MDGLTNIITKINLQNDEQCQAVINCAAEKAQEIVESAKAEAEKYLNKQREILKTKEEAEKSKAVSAAEFEYKRVILH